MSDAGVMVYLPQEYSVLVIDLYNQHVVYI